MEKKTENTIGFRVRGLRFRVQEGFEALYGMAKEIETTFYFEFRVKGSGLGFRIQGLGFKLWGLLLQHGFAVYGLASGGLRKRPSNGDSWASYKAVHATTILKRKPASIMGRCSNPCL